MLNMYSRVYVLTFTLLQILLNFGIERSCIMFHNMVIDDEHEKTLEPFELIKDI